MCYSLTIFSFHGGKAPKPPGSLRSILPYLQHKRGGEQRIQFRNPPPPTTPIVKGVSEADKDICITSLQHKHAIKIQQPQTLLSARSLSLLPEKGQTFHEEKYGNYGK